jgi:dTDP-glucose 4,6-dehydratase
VITRALSDQQIPLYGDGENIRDWIHTYDHCKGIDLIVKKGQIGETYLLGGNGERSNIDVLENLLDLLGKPDSLITYVKDRKGHDRRYAIDFTKAQDELGFKPEKPFEEWLKQTVEWFKQNEWWWKPLKKEADKIAEKYLSMAG